MPNKGLFIFVEGADDERLLKHLYDTQLHTQYAWVETYQYAQRPFKDVKKFIQTVPKMGHDYLYFANRYQQ